MLAVSALSVAYGMVEAVRDVSLKLEAGSIAAVVGANGAGKTTLLNAIMGLLPAKGDISFAGESLARYPTEERVTLGMSLVPESQRLFTTMSVRDNLVLGAGRCSGAETAHRFGEVYGRFPRLQERCNQLAGTLSGGERQMLAMGRALMGRPRLLMLDEPSLGLAPLVVREIFHIIAKLREEGVAVLLVEQNARAALEIADYAYVMELGEISMHGAASELAQDERVIASYLGLGGEFDEGEEEPATLSD